MRISRVNPISAAILGTDPDEVLAAITIRIKGREQTTEIHRCVERHIKTYVDGRMISFITNCVNVCVTDVHKTIPCAESLFNLISSRVDAALSA